MRIVLFTLAAEFYFRCREADDDSYMLFPTTDVDHDVVLNR